MVIKNEKGLFQKYLEWETVADFLSSLKFKYENRNGNFKENKQNKLGLHWFKLGRSTEWKTVFLNNCWKQKCFYTSIKKN